MDRATASQCAALLHDAQTNPNPIAAQRAWKTAQRLMGAASGASAPARGPNVAEGSWPQPPVPHSTIQFDQVHPPAAGDYVQPLMAPSRILHVPAIPVVPPATTVTGIQLQFSAGGGWLIGWKGTIADFDTLGAFAAGPLEQRSIGVRLYINDGEELITNGLGADFVPFSDLFSQETDWAPIMRRMDVKDILNLEFQNFQPAVAGAQTLQPSLSFAFWRERYPGA